MKETPTITPEMREFFRRCGARGGRKRNRVVTKKQISTWGKKGGKTGGRGRKKNP